MARRSPAGFDGAVMPTHVAVGLATGLLVPPVCATARCSAAARNGVSVVAPYLAMSWTARRSAVLSRSRYSCRRCHASARGTRANPRGVHRRHLLPLRCPPLARHQNTRSNPAGWPALLRRASPGRRARASGLATTWVHRATAPTHRRAPRYLTGCPTLSRAAVCKGSGTWSLLEKGFIGVLFTRFSFRIGACTVLVGSSDPENCLPWAQVPRRTPTTQVQSMVRDRAYLNALSDPRSSYL